MKKLRNTLYLTTQGSYLHKKRETLSIRLGEQQVAQIPIHQINDIHCFGNIMVSPFVMGLCGEHDVSIAFYTEYGKFLGRLQGQQSGNILLRQQQYGLTHHQNITLAKHAIAAKLQASRQVLMRHMRNHGDLPEMEQAQKNIQRNIKALAQAKTLDGILGLEGESASYYFSAFPNLITQSARKDFTFSGRNKRPPTDPINAMLSFLYSVVSNSIAAALQGVGLDSQMGFLHQPRPGRQSLALDLVEEFRAWLVDRLVLSLVNRGQVKSNDFITQASGAVMMKDNIRKQLLTALQERKQQEIMHPYFQEKMPIGLLFHAQALLLARYIRGDLAEYPPFLIR